MLVAVLCLAIAPAGGDEIHLRNGDRITGTLVRKSGDKLIVKTSYAGEITISWSEVIGITTEQPVGLMLGEQAPEQAILEPAGDGALRARAESGETVEAPLANLTYLNPTPAEAGIGIDYSGRVNLSLAASQGNTENERLYGEAELSGRAREYRFTLGGRGNHATQSDATSASNWLAYGSYDYFVGPRSFIYGRGSVERDRFRDVDLRSTAGAGYGRQLLDSKRASLSMQAGLDYVAIERVTGTDETYPSAGWGVGFSYWLLEDRAQAFHDQQGFWALTGDNGVLLRTRTGLRLPLKGGLNATLQVNADWESQPAPGFESLDTTWLLGLGYQW